MLDGHGREGAVPSLAGSGGPPDLVRARSAPGDSGRGRPPMHAGRIRLDGDTGANLEERGGGTPKDLQSRAGGRRASRCVRRDAPYPPQRYKGAREWAGCAPWGRREGRRQKAPRLAPRRVAPGPSFDPGPVYRAILGPFFFEGVGGGRGGIMAPIAAAATPSPIPRNSPGAARPAPHGHRLRPVPRRRRSGGMVAGCGPRQPPAAPAPPRPPSGAPLIVPAPDRGNA